MLGSWLKTWISDLAAKTGRRGSIKLDASLAGMTAPPCPEIPVAIIGDIHGRFDLLTALLGKIEKQAPHSQLVFVGDYVDRGPDSRKVVQTLKDLGTRAICLRGNHEEMLLGFLDNPIKNGGRWLRFGGIETLASFGIALDETADQNAVLAACESLKTALSDGTENWLCKLPVYWQSGNLLVTHAGPDPAASIQGQEEAVFLWGHRRFLRDMRADGLWVAHGHWIRDRPVFSGGRIGVDTGAWKSNRLTAALISAEGDVNFIST